MLHYEWLHLSAFCPRRHLQFNTHQWPLGAIAGFQRVLGAGKGHEKAKGNALFLSLVLGNGDQDKMHVMGTRGGMGTQRNALQKALFVSFTAAGCFRGGMETSAEQTPPVLRWKMFPRQGIWQRERCGCDSLPQTQLSTGRTLQHIPLLGAYNMG